MVEKVYNKGHGPYESGELVLFLLFNTFYSKDSHKLYSVKSLATILCFRYSWLANVITKLAQNNKRYLLYFIVTFWNTENSKSRIIIMKS